MKKTLIPEDNSIESIHKREQIIRDYYREWKEKNPVAFIGKARMTVGVKRRTHEKVQYCITAIESL